MRAYHFLNELHGLDNLRKRRLKIATINDLNDPFELLGVLMDDKEHRPILRWHKDLVANDKGMLCFSRDWRNPVQWSHYADKHRGLCLGFDIDDRLTEPVTYTRKRLSITGFMRKSEDEQLRILESVLTTKYSHWRYENEVRVFARLENPDSESGLYFHDFTKDIKLAEVIVGPESKVSRESIRQALGDLAPSIAVFKARLAFKSFGVIRQKKEKLWV